MDPLDMLRAYNSQHPAIVGITEHSHECRDCGADIECTGDGDTCWDGGNAGCTECPTHDGAAAEAIKYLTSDGETVTEGMTVWTNEARQGVVTKIAVWAADYGQPAGNAWHEITYPDGRVTQMNKERISARKPYGFR